MSRLWCFVIAVFLLGGSQLAFARDHMELVCSAVAEPADGSENQPLFIHFFESRAKDATSRDEVASTIYQGKLFRSSWLNKSDGLAKAAPLVLKAGTQVRFRGTYSLVQTNSSYALEVVGKLTADPRARKPVYHDVKLSLPCVDLSI